MKKLSVLLLTVALILPVFALGDYSALLDFATKTGFDIDIELLDRARQNDEIKNLSLFSVDISLDEALYDGVWLFTSAKFSTESDNFLLVPANISPSDKMENGLSYADYAIKNNKRLIVVSALPSFFSMVEESFFESFEHDGFLYFISAGKIDLQDNGLLFDWLINVYEADENLNSSLRASATVPGLPLFFGENKLYEYLPENPEVLRKITLMTSDFGTYFKPEFVNEEMSDSYLIAFLDENGNEIPRAFELDYYSLEIKKAPKSLKIRLMYDGCAKADEVLELEIVEE